MADGTHASFSLDLTGEGAERLLRRFAVAAEAAAHEGEKAEKGVGSLGRELDGLGRIAGGNVIARLVEQAAQLGKAFVVSSLQIRIARESMEASFATILGGADKATRAMAELNRIASKPGLTYDVGAKGFQALIGADMNPDLAIKYMQQLGNAAARTGGGVEEVGRMVLNLQQILNSGKISEEDWGRGLLRQIPKLGVVLKKEFGDSTAEGVMKASGSIDQFVVRFLKALESLDRAPDLTANALLNLRNEWDQAKNEFGKGLLGNNSKQQVDELAASLRDARKLAGDLGASLHTGVAPALGEALGYARLLTSETTSWWQKLAAVALKVGDISKGWANLLTGGGLGMVEDLLRRVGIDPSAWAHRKVEGWVGAARVEGAAAGAMAGATPLDGIGKPGGTGTGNTPWAGDAKDTADKAAKEAERKEAERLQTAVKAAQVAFDEVQRQSNAAAGAMPGVDLMTRPSRADTLKATIERNIGNVFSKYAEGMNCAYSVSTMLQQSGLAEAEVPGARSLLDYYGHHPEMFKPVSSKVAGSGSGMYVGGIPSGQADSGWHTQVAFGGQSYGTHHNTFQNQGGVGEGEWYEVLPGPGIAGEPAKVTAARKALHDAQMAEAVFKAAHGDTSALVEMQGKLKEDEAKAMIDLLDRQTRAESLHWDAAKRGIGIAEEVFKRYGDSSIALAGMKDGLIGVVEQTAKLHKEWADYQAAMRKSDLDLAQIDAQAAQDTMSQAEQHNAKLQARLAAIAAYAEAQRRVIDLTEQDLLANDDLLDDEKARKEAMQARLKLTEEIGQAQERAMLDNLTQSPELLGMRAQLAKTPAEETDWLTKQVDALRQKANWLKNGAEHQKEYLQTLLEIKRIEEQMRNKRTQGQEVLAATLGGAGSLQSFLKRQGGGQLGIVEGMPDYDFSHLLPSNRGYRGDAPGGGMAGAAATGVGQGFRDGAGMLAAAVYDATMRGLRDVARGV